MSVPLSVCRGVGESDVAIAAEDRRTASVMIATMEISPVTPQRWDDLVAAFGRRGNDPGWCWCRRFVDPPREELDPVNNRDALRREIDTAHVPPGLIVYVDGVPAGWSRVMPRSALPGVLANRALRRVLADDPTAWWVTCFAVEQRHRNLGVATALLDAAVAHARRHGASAVEGHPVDTDALTATRVSGSALFTGTLRTFLKLGFTEIGRTFPSRPVMRLEL
jgi:GNAT superfamily N-acetyltransferase